MGKRNGPKTQDALNTPDKVEDRRFTVKSERVEPPSNVVWHFDCPFCKADVKAYLWSLAGGGKRCDCGAMFTHRGLARHWRGHHPADGSRPERVE